MEDLLEQYLVSIEKSYKGDTSDDIEEDFDIDELAEMASNSNVASKELFKELNSSLLGKKTAHVLVISERINTFSNIIYTEIEDIFHKISTDPKNEYIHNHLDVLSEMSDIAFEIARLSRELKKLRKRL